MNDIDFRIIETERKIIDILNTCGLSTVTISMIINGIKDNIDINKIKIIEEYKKKVNDNDDITESNHEGTIQ